MIAPLAGIRTQDFADSAAVVAGEGLNVLNLSYAMIGLNGYRLAQIAWSPREASIIQTAREGSGIVVKAAGNDGVAVGASTATGRKDYLNSALIGTRTTLFVGALDRHGSVDDPATIASYSNIAGNNRRVQRRFVTVGVPGSETYLYGTSFAAPVVSGYAAILGSKFRRASPIHIVNRIVRTARSDTIADYNPAVHGSGEASLSRALAPLRIR
jgi:subtilisin family serine protease